MKLKIVLIGGGGHCRSCIDVIESCGKYEIAGILDPALKTGEDVSGYPVIGNDDELPVKDVFGYLVTVGQIKDPSPRVRIYERLKTLGLNLPVIFSSSAYVSSRGVIGEGTIVMHQALINAGAVIGCNCIINSKALVEHDVTIGDFCHVSTGSCLNGGVVLGNGSFVGSNAVINQGVKVPDNVVIASGSVVTAGDRLSGGRIYWGNPLREKS